MFIDIQQIFLLLSGFKGAVLFNLLLILPITVAILATIRVRRRADRAYYRRLVSGLGLLLIFQLIHIAVSVLFDFYLFPPAWLPVVEWVLYLTSILVITWLWAVPLVNRRLDDLVVAIGVILVALVGLSSLWWMSQPGGQIYLMDWPDFIFSVSALIILFIGILTILIRQVYMWGFGLIMLLLLGLGTLGFLLGVQDGSEFPIQIRFALVMAYPLLMVLPQRLLLHVGVGASEEEDIEKLEQLKHIERQRAILDSRPSFTDPKVLQSIFDMVEDPDPESVSRKISATISRIMQADISLLVLQSAINGEYRVQSGFDSKKEISLEGFFLPVDRMPVIKASLISGETLTIEPNRTSPDLLELTQCLNLTRSGPVLISPVFSTENKPDAGIILLSPYSSRKWTEGDQYYLTVLAKLLVHFLQHSREITRLRDQLSRTQQIEPAMVAVEPPTEPTRLQKSVSRYSRLTGEGQKGSDQEWVSIVQVTEAERIKGELTLALMEIATLRAALDESAVNPINQTELSNTH